MFARERKQVTAGHVHTRDAKRVQKPSPRRGARRCHGFAWPLGVTGRAGTLSEGRRCRCRESERLLWRVAVRTRPNGRWPPPTRPADRAAPRGHHHGRHDLLGAAKASGEGECPGRPCEKKQDDAPNPRAGGQHAPLEERRWRMPAPCARPAGRPPARLAAAGWRGRGRCRATERA
jgi:hypothetical protein